MVGERIREYEMMMVISPEGGEDEVSATVERINNVITQRGGNVSEQEILGVRRLAYPIQRFQEGNYVLTKFTLDAKDVIEIERTLTAAQDVLRHLVTKVDKSAQ